MLPVIAEQLSGQSGDVITFDQGQKQLKYLSEIAGSTDLMKKAFDTGLGDLPSIIARLPSAIEGKARSQTIAKESQATAKIINDDTMARQNTVADAEKRFKDESRATVKQRIREKTAGGIKGERGEDQEYAISYAPSTKGSGSRDTLGTHQLQALREHGQEINTERMGTGRAATRANKKLKQDTYSALTQETTTTLEGDYYGSLKNMLPNIDKEGRSFGTPASRKLLESVIEPTRVDEDLFDDQESFRKRKGYIAAQDIRVKGKEGSDEMIKNADVLADALFTITSWAVGAATKETKGSPLDLGVDDLNLKGDAIPSLDKLAKALGEARGREDIKDFKSYLETFQREGIQIQGQTQAQAVRSQVGDLSKPVDGRPSARDALEAQLERLKEQFKSVDVKDAFSLKIDQLVPKANIAVEQLGDQGTNMHGASVILGRAQDAVSKYENTKRFIESDQFKNLPPDKQEEVQSAGSRAIRNYQRHNSHTSCIRYSSRGKRR